MSSYEMEGHRDRTRRRRSRSPLHRLHSSSDHHYHRRRHRQQRTPNRHHRETRFEYGTRSRRQSDDNYMKVRPDLKADRVSRRAIPYSNKVFHRSMPERYGYRSQRYIPPVAFAQMNKRDVPRKKVVDIDEMPDVIPERSTTELMINAVPIKIKETSLVCIVFIKIFGIVSDEKKDELTADTTKDDIHRNMKMEALQSLVSQMLEIKKYALFRDPMNPEYVYDRMGVFYTFDNLRDTHFEFEFDAASFEFNDQDAMYLQRYTKYHVSIHHKDYINPTFIHKDREAVKFQHFLQIYTSHYLVKSKEFLWYGNKFFYKENPQKLHHGMVVRNGYEKRILLLPRTMMEIYGTRFLLQLDAIKAVFRGKSSVLEHFAGMGIGKLQLENRQTWPDLESLIRFAIAETTHLSYTRRFPVIRLSNHCADTQTFVLNDADDDYEREISVADYFKERRNITLKYPSYPCLVDPSGACFPLEVLNIADGQIIPESKIKDKDIKDACVIDPSTKFEKILEALTTEDLLGFRRTKGFFAKRLKLETKFFEVTAQNIYKPSIIYGKNQMSLNYASWSDDGQQFLEPASNSKLAIVDYNLTNRQTDDFVYELQDLADEHGMNLGRLRIFTVLPQSEDNFSTEKYGPREVYELLANREYTATIILSDDPKFHDAAKFTNFERLGPVLYLNYQQDAQNVNRLKQAVRKLNVLLGGINFDITTDARLAKSIGDIDFLGSILRDTLVVAAAVSVGPLFSCVGYAATINKLANRFPTSFYCQGGKDYFIDGTYLGAKIVESMKMFKSETGAFPKRIIYYRAQIYGQNNTEVKEKEVDVIKKTLCSLCEESNIPYPKFLTVEIARDSNYCCMLKEDNDPTRPPIISNVNPATVLTGLSINKEFLLFSRRLARDAVKPVICTVLDEAPEKWLNLNHLAHFTNALCFLNQKATCAYKIPDMLYAAEEMAIRGKLYLNEYQRRRGKLALEQLMKTKEQKEVAAELAKEFLVK